MAMEKQFSIHDTHTQPITALGFHPVRREIVVGFEGKWPLIPTTIVTTITIWFLLKELENLNLYDIK